MGRVDRTPAPQARLADGHGYSPSPSKCWASVGSGRGGLRQRRRARHMSGAGVGGVWGPWWGACHPPPQPTVLFSSSRLFAVPSPLSVASALEGPTAERLLKGEGQPLLLGGPRAPHSVTSPHLLHTNKTLTRVPSRLPRAGVQCPLHPPHPVWPGLCVCRDASWRDPGAVGGLTPSEG